MAARIIRKTTTTMRATALSMTSDFAAPKVQASGQATKHTDMFAYGKTVSCLQDHCEPGEEVLAAGHSQVVNFAFEIRRESNPRSYLTRSSTLTTRPTVYIQIGTEGSHHM